MTILTLEEMREALGEDAVGLTDDQVREIGMRAEVFAEVIVGIRKKQVKENAGRVFAAGATPAEGA